MPGPIGLSWSSISDWIECHPGLWSLIQGVGTFGAIFIAIWLPRLQANKIQCEHFVTIRNICWINARLLHHVSDLLSANPAGQRHVDKFQYCNTSIQEINLYDIYPSRILPKVVHLQGLMIRTIEVLNRPDADLALLSQMGKEARDIMKILDARIFEIGGQIADDDEKMAYLK